MRDVADYAAVQRRRRELFPPLYEPVVPQVARVSGSGIYHCDICPKRHDEDCPDSCATVRAKLATKDGVVVT
jgi:hypothetical protein